MNYNPYAAPQGQLPQQQQPQAGMPQPWDVGEVYAAAWEVFKKEWAVVVLSWVLVIFLIGVPTQVVRFMFFPVPQARLMGLGEMVSFYQSMAPLYSVTFVFQAFFDVGLIRIQCAAARGETPNFATLFSGGSRFLPLLAVKLILAIFIGFGSIFLVVPGVLVFLALWPVDYFIVDANQDIGTAFKSAMNATRGQWMALFLFFLLGVLLYMGGFLACCIGWLATYPLYRVAKAIVFLRISGRGAAILAAPSPYAQPQQYPPAGGGYGYGPPPAGGGFPPPGGAPPGGGWGPPQ